MLLNLSEYAQYNRIGESVLACLNYETFTSQDYHEAQMRLSMGTLYMREVLCKCKAGRQESASTMPTMLAS